jgi:hypothetical protein
VLCVGVENSGNSFDDGLGEGGLYSLCFHPAGGLNVQPTMG